MTLGQYSGLRPEELSVRIDRTAAQVIASLGELATDAVRAQVRAGVESSLRAEPDAIGVNVCGEWGDRREIAVTITPVRTIEELRTLAQERAKRMEQEAA